MSRTEIGTCRAKLKRKFVDIFRKSTQHCFDFLAQDLLHVKALIYFSGEKSLYVKCLLQHRQLEQLNEQPNRNFESRPEGN